MVAALDALRELDFLRGGEQVDLADVFEEELQRVGRDLALDRRGNLFLLDAAPSTTEISRLSSVSKNESSTPGSRSSSTSASAISSAVSDPATLPASSRVFASSVASIASTFSSVPGITVAVSLTFPLQGPCCMTPTLKLTLRPRRTSQCLRWRRKCA